MNKLLVSLMLLALACGPVSSDAAPPEPAKQDILVIKHTLLTLWNMGMTSPQQMGEAELLHTTLLFLMRGQLNDSCEIRGDYPTRFSNLPQNYDMFFSSADVEKAAFLVFNGFVGTQMPNGVFLGAEGYYVDNKAFYSEIVVNGDSFQPSYCTIESMMQQPDGTLILNGKVRRFKQLNSAEETLFGSALFMARFAPTERGWQLVTYIFTEEAMG